MVGIWECTPATSSELSSMPTCCQTRTAPVLSEWRWEWPRAGSSGSWPTPKCRTRTWNSWTLLGQRGTSTVSESILIFARRTLPDWRCQCCCRTWRTKQCMSRSRPSWAECSSSAECRSSHSGLCVCWVHHCYCFTAPQSPLRLICCSQSS